MPNFHFILSVEEEQALEEAARERDVAKADVAREALRDHLGLGGGKSLESRLRAVERKLGLK